MVFNLKMMYKKRGRSFAFDVSENIWKVLKNLIAGECCSHFYSGNVISEQLRRKLTYSQTGFCICVYTNVYLAWMPKPHKEENLHFQKS